MSNSGAYYASIANQLRAWKFLALLMIAPGAAFAAMYVEAELGRPSVGDSKEVLASVIGRSKVKIWGLVTRPQLLVELEPSHRRLPAVLMTLAGDDVAESATVLVAKQNPQSAFVVGDFPYWPYALAFAVSPGALAWLASYYEKRYRFRGRVPSE